MALTRESIDDLEKQNLLHDHSIDQDSDVSHLDNDEGLSFEKVEPRSVPEQFQVDIEHDVVPDLVPQASIPLRAVVALVANVASTIAITFLNRVYVQHECASVSLQFTDSL